MVAVVTVVAAVAAVAVVAVVAVVSLPAAAPVLDPASPFSAQLRPSQLCYPHLDLEGARVKLSRKLWPWVEGGGADEVDWINPVEAAAEEEVKHFQAETKDLLFYTVGPGG